MLTTRDGDLAQSRTHTENQAVCVDNTRTHEASRTRAKMQAVMFAPHELINSCWKSGGLCWQHTNSRSHEPVQKIRWLCLQHTNSRSHELVLKIRRLAFITHEVTNPCQKSGGCVCSIWTHEHTILRKRCGACVCCINARSHELTIFPEKGVFGLLATTNQLAESEKNQEFHEFVTWSQNVLTIFVFSKCTSHELMNSGLLAWVREFVRS